MRGWSSAWFCEAPDFVMLWYFKDHPQIHLFLTITHKTLHAHTAPTPPSAQRKEKSVQRKASEKRKGEDIIKLTQKLQKE